ncbi:hypothetical protein C2S52_020996 [Perilla frutescens var. hirtella]|nr:hypothetical protein C2S52_020996 [Perilla frutescens var. hirtella]
MEIIIYNELPDKMIVLCASKDDDLDEHIVDPGNHYNISFCYIPFITKFYCYLQWGDKSRDFAAYKGMWAFRNVPCGYRKDDCSWFAHSDGIYLYEDKRYDWDLKTIMSDRLTDQDQQHRRKIINMTLK